MKKVAILMGSDSDLQAMQGCKDVLDKLGIPSVMRVMSAHRTPDVVHEFVGSAKQNGFGCIVAGAGLAAHLAGVVASITRLPVIGVPMEGGPLKGMDALLSTVQMPPGVPVATTAIGKVGAKNAGWLAARILALSDDALAEKLEQAVADMAEAVKEKDRSIQ